MSDVSDAAALIGVATGIIGMVTGVAALILNYATRRDVLRSQRPVIEIIERPAGAQWKENPDWTAFQLKLRSRSNIGYKAQTLTVIWPPSGKLDRYRHAGVGPSGAATFAKLSGARTIKLNLSVAHAGSEPHRGSVGGLIQGTGESHSEDLFFKASPSIWSKAVRSLYKARSDSSQSLWASFIVRLTDQNAVTTLHRRTVRLTIRTIVNSQTGTTP